jgi:hypothetical protein
MDERVGSQWKGINLTKRPRVGKPHGRRVHLLGDERLWVLNLKTGFRFCKSTCTSNLLSMIPLRRTLFLFVLSPLLLYGFFYTELKFGFTSPSSSPSSSPSKVSTSWYLPVGSWQLHRSPKKGFEDVEFRPQLRKVSKIAVTSINFGKEVKELQSLSQLCDLTDGRLWSILIVQEDEQALSPLVASFPSHCVVLRSLTPLPSSILPPLPPFSIPRLLSSFVSSPST